jgi:Domain of unknown function (DUF6970)
MKRVILFSAIILLLFFAGCSELQPEGTPPWLTTYISECEADTSNDITYNTDQIWRYEYKGNIVFYFMSGCCDFYNWVYDYDGNLMGAPDGGYTGLGDGRLTDWATKKSNGELLWTKPRE